MNAPRALPTRAAVALRIADGGGATAYREGFDAFVMGVSEEAACAFIGEHWRTIGFALACRFAAGWLAASRE